MLHTSIQSLATLARVAVDGPATSLGGTAGPDLTRYLVVCSLLLGGIVFLAWAFRRLVGRSLAARAAQRSLQVMDMLPMGGKQRLAVVRCYDRTFLLGMGEKEVSLVAELDSVIAPETEPEPTPADRRAFADLLTRARPAKPLPAQPAAAPAQVADTPPSLGAGVLG